MRKSRDQSMKSADQSLPDALSAGGILRAESRPTERKALPSLDEQIRLRAYEMYLERGARPNDDLGDWLRAERELRGSPVEV
jgi:hypothetical protein